MIKYILPYLSVLIKMEKETVMKNVQIHTYVHF